MTNTVPSVPFPLAQDTIVDSNTVEYSVLDNSIPGGLAMLPLMIGSLMGTADDESQTENPTPDPSGFSAMFEKAVENKTPVQLAIQIENRVWILAIK
jgi:hypothetical protein